ncbi:MAG: YciI family protein [Thermoanaerobaculia bacterium]
MRYLLLIYGEESGWQNLGEEELGPILDDYWALDDALRESGNYLASEPLQPTATATSVRVREGKTVITDGPFAETKEQLGGFYMVEASDVDEAIAIAARIPGARTGTIEVRPIHELTR